MTVRIEAGVISGFAGTYQRQVEIICDSGIIWAETITSKCKDDLEIVDHENFMKE